MNGQSFVCILMGFSVADGDFGSWVGLMLLFLLLLLSPKGYISALEH